MLMIPKNWASFQHYKDRAPPWIKLHKNLLDDRTFQRLPVASRALAPMLWLLASESSDGSFDASVEELSFRLRTSEQEIRDGLGPLIHKGFFLPVHGDSTVLAECLHGATPEGEAEAEKEAEKKAPRKRSAAPASVDKPEDVSEQTWADWLQLRKAKRAPVTPSVVDGARAESLKAGMPLQRFLEIWCMRGSQGLQAEWLRADERTSRADIRSHTVPGTAGPDPALEKIKRNAEQAAPMPAAVRELAQKLKAVH